MAITSFPVSYQSAPEDIKKFLAASPLTGKEQNEVLWSFDAIQVWQDWFTARYGALMEIRHRSNPHDPPEGETKERRSFEDRHESTKAYIDYTRPRCVELHRGRKNLFVLFLSSRRA